MFKMVCKLNIKMFLIKVILICFSKQYLLVVLLSLIGLILGAPQIIDEEVDINININNGGGYGNDGYGYGGGYNNYGNGGYDNGYGNYGGYDYK